MPALGAGVRASLRHARATPPVCSDPLVRVPGEPQPQAKHRTGPSAHRPSGSRANGGAIQAAPTLSSMFWTRPTHGAFCSASRCDPTVRSSSSATADRTNCSMTSFRFVHRRLFRSSVYCRAGRSPSMVGATSARNGGSSSPRASVGADSANQDRYFAHSLWTGAVQQLPAPDSGPFAAPGAEAPRAFRDARCHPACRSRRVR